MNHVDLEQGIALRRVKDDDIETCLDEEFEAISVARSCAHGSGGIELLAVGILAGEGVVLVFEEIRTGEEGGKTIIVIDNGKFPLLGGTEDFVGFCECNTLGCGDKGCSHDITKEGLRQLKLHVAGSDDTNKLGSQRSGF